jgi:predicted glycogen debranching enzyme
MINFKKEICTNFNESSSREWLETNGIGGFAASTISGANTRRYHGLLTAATRPPLGRVTLLSKFEETVSIDGETFELSSNQFPESINPTGFEFLSNFRLDPFPVWTYEVEGIEIEKKVFMVHGQNATVCSWIVKNLSKMKDRKIQITLKPLFSFVDYHSLQHESDDAKFDFVVGENYVSLNSTDETPELFLNHNAESVAATGFWYRNFEYAIEKERGFDFREDLFQPFSLQFDLSKPAKTIVSLENQTKTNAETLEKNEITRRKNLLKTAGVKDDFAKQLVLAADQYIVARGDGKTVIAGYPWFSDWGRDTMISLTGLTLATNRPEIAKSIIREFSNYISDGMLPNRFPDQGEEAEYNTVDATLWYFEAIRAYVEKTGDFDFVEKELYPKLVEIIIWHLKGTRYKIHVDTDGLLYSGEAGVQLTWMDAKYGDEVFTPRTGKAVEIQALWYNALRIMVDFANKFGDRDGASQFKSTAEIAKESFNNLFWNEAEECLYDVVKNGEKDASIRPNQIFAVSLAHTMVSIGRAKKIVQKVESELLTPVGLRSLARSDAQYRPTYIGSPYDRDSSYHQGTVWGWLIGPFVDAYRKVNPNGHKTEQRVAELLSGFGDHLSEAGLRQISEIFDAEAPHDPRGCFAQAWSVAEVLRVLI